MEKGPQKNNMELTGYAKPKNHFGDLQAALAGVKANGSKFKFTFQNTFKLDFEEGSGSSSSGHRKRKQKRGTGSRTSGASGTSDGSGARKAV